MATNASPQPLTPNEFNNFLDIIARKLKPHFAGLTLTAATAETSSKRRVRFLNGKRQAILRPFVDRSETIVIRADYPFKFGQQNLIRTFARCIQDISLAFPTQAFWSALEFLDARVAAISSAPQFGGLPLKIIQRLLTWSQQTHEGRPILAAIALDGSLSSEDSHWTGIEDFWKLDLGRVLGNGMDSAIVVDSVGRVRDYIYLDPSQMHVPHSTKEDRPAPMKPIAMNYCPGRFQEIGNWTSQSRRRSAYVLTRAGEILVFRQGSLVSARRSGGWQFFPHAHIQKLIGTSLNGRTSLRVIREVYLTCIDASFSRTGACLCIGEWTKLRDSDTSEAVVSKEDWVQDSQAPTEPLGAKRLALASARVAGKFDELPRSIRRELSSADGATIVDLHGALCAVGAIIRVGAGSDGGGRKAAAMALSHFGVAIKVSSDGELTGFVQGKELFRLCRRAN